jgi:hypothetical protein
VSCLSLILCYNTDSLLARIETEKKISLINAWEESEKAKAENKYVNMFLYNFFYN